MAEDLLGIGKAIEAISRELASLISPLLRPGAEVGGHLIADQMNYWRLRRTLLLVEKTMALLKSKNIEPKAVPPKILSAVLNSGSLEEDEELTSKWAGLLASAASGDEIHPSYPGILAQLTPHEARMLDALYERHIENISSNKIGSLLRIRILYQKIGLFSDQFLISLDNLRRLELCSIPTIDPLMLFNDGSDERIELRALGINFVETCRGPST